MPSTLATFCIDSHRLWLLGAGIGPVLRRPWLWCHLHWGGMGQMQGKDMCLWDPKSNIIPPTMPSSLC